MKSPQSPDRSRREWLAVAAVTAIGFGLRTWPVGGLGLSHFDEGIYALVSTWSLQPKGLSGLDPTLISYAPPGYPILGGLAYWLLGRSDGALIAVSQLAGTLTIPVVAWLARRTFGPGAGYASAVLCAFSGSHIAFSRMALTDSSFVLAWLVAIGLGMRFLERPTFARGVAMGVMVGLAQQFKYNGWLTGGIVVGAAMLGLLTKPEDRRPGPMARTFGWGAVGGLAAWLVVWPWYAFVERHGGYSALLRHQRSYLGGFGDWWPNLLTQADQATALSGGDGLILVGVLLCALTPWVGRWPIEQIRSGRAFWVLTFGACLLTWILAPAPYWLGLVLAPWLLLSGRASGRMLGAWWLILAAMSPFYHPYARLWLPLHAINWLLMGWLVAEAPAAYFTYRAKLKATGSGRRAFRLASVASACLFGLGAVIAVPRLDLGPGSDRTGLLAPSDTLYRACSEVANALPEDVRTLRLLARPPVTFYLAGRVGLAPMAGSDGLLRRGDPSNWALVDSAILRSEIGGPSEGNGRDLLQRFAKDWELVGEFPTDPSLPTLLDLDPTLARSSKGDRSYPLWLLRPRSGKAPR
jgi:4-amino-4-deoxy-L-arabinose transferase-like glycosyltransferase